MSTRGTPSPAGSRSEVSQRWLPGLLAALLLAAAPMPAVATDTEEILFERADKVVLARVTRFDGGERPPDWSPSFRYRYQVLWTEDVKVFKGAPVGKLGYDVVMLPFQERSIHAPWFYFERPFTPADLPPDHTLLLYLERDSNGNLRIMGGPDGVFRYPGFTRMRNLEKLAKQHGHTKPGRGAETGARSGLLLER